jgi:hypothetical protein
VTGADHSEPDVARSANTPQAGEVFHKIGGGRNAFGGFGHPGGDLAGPRDVVRGEDGAQIRDQRLLGNGRKVPGGAQVLRRSRTIPECRSSYRRPHSVRPRYCQSSVVLVTLAGSVKLT